VSWLSRWLKTGGEDKRPAKGPPNPTSLPQNVIREIPSIPGRTPDQKLERALSVGEPDGATAEEALAVLEASRASPNEAVVLEGLVRRAQNRPLPEPVAIAVASALVDRGEPVLAEGLLKDATSPAGRVLLADLMADRGDLALALATVERVLLRDIDHPGAADRHRRWRAQLGLAPREARPVASSATLATSRPEAPFRLLREVARGGSGAVYEAEDTELLRKVALKVYHHHERDRAQLLHEAKVAVSLAGPSIVRVFDVDPDQGWVALEWAPFGALRELVRAKSLDLVPIERWALPLASALAGVHAAGWVHHDVKPANVLLRSLGSPMLGDFGTARRVGDPPPPGSLGYVSPERMAGRASDPRDDVYGFGRVLEDALEALDDDPLWARFRPLVAACLGADDARPADARALVTRLRVETA
jgi:eukaryotic-like serine/threonine-protein kinase